MIKIHENTKINQDIFLKREGTRHLYQVIPAAFISFIQRQAKASQTNLHPKQLNKMTTHHQLARDWGQTWPSSPVTTIVSSPAENRECLMHTFRKSPPPSFANPSLQGVDLSLCRVCMCRLVTSGYFMHALVRILLNKIIETSMHLFNAEDMALNLLCKKKT
jgi:hypothetical protein